MRVSSNVSRIATGRMSTSLAVSCHLLVLSMINNISPVDGSRMPELCSLHGEVGQPHHLIITRVHPRPHNYTHASKLGITIASDHPRSINPVLVFETGLRSIYAESEQLVTPLNSTWLAQGTPPDLRALRSPPLTNLLCFQKKSARRKGLYSCGKLVAVVVDESIRCDLSGTFGGRGDTPIFAHNFSSTYVDVILSLDFCSFIWTIGRRICFSGSESLDDARVR